MKITIFKIILCCTLLSPFIIKGMDQQLPTHPSIVQINAQELCGYWKDEAFRDYLRKEIIGLFNRIYKTHFILLYSGNPIISEASIIAQKGYLLTMWSHINTFIDQEATYPLNINCFFKPCDKNLISINDISLGALKEYWGNHNASGFLLEMLVLLLATEKHLKFINSRITGCLEYFKKIEHTSTQIQNGYETMQKTLASIFALIAKATKIINEILKQHPPQKLQNFKNVVSSSSSSSELKLENDMDTLRIH